MVHPSLGRVLLGAALVLGATLIARGAAMYVAVQLGDTRDGLLLGVGVLAGSLAGALVLRRIARRPREELAVVSVPLPRVLAWTAAGLALGAAFDLAAWLGGRPVFEADWHHIFAAGPVWLLALGMVVASVFEELFFRGWLFGGLARTRLGAAGAIAVTALLFAAAHGPGSIWRFADVAASGALLALARWRTGSSLPGMLPHALGNLKVLALLALSR